MDGSLSVGRMLEQVAIWAWRTVTEWAERVGSSSASVEVAVNFGVHG